MARNRIKRTVWIASDGALRRERQSLLREIPFEVQLRAGQALRSVASTTRTPGNDYELAAGLLYSEGYIKSRHDFSHMTYCMDNALEQEYNLLTVALRTGKLPDPPRPEQIIVDGAACGVSSQSMLESVETLAQQWNLPPVGKGPQAAPEELRTLADGLAAAQTPGLSAVALGSAAGDLLEVRQDVRALQALDKLVGWGLLQGSLPFAEGVLVLSGRATFAALKKCAIAGAPIVCSTGLPSSLAVSVAQRFGQTLLTVDEDGVTVYSGEQRLDIAVGMEGQERKG